MMEATMTYDDATTAPAADASTIGFAGAFGHQFRFLWDSRRPLLLIVLMVGFLTLSGEPWTMDEDARLFIAWPLWIVLLGPLWAFAVWHGEGPSKRHYMWSQPVSRLTHSMARVAAGLAWLWVGIAVLILMGSVFALSDGDFWQITAFQAGGWVNYFTGPMLGYLAFSLLNIASDYPIRWAAGLLFGIPFVLVIFIDWLDIDPESLEWIVEWFVNETWGLGTALIGGVAFATEALDGLQGQRVSDLPFSERWWLAMIGWAVFLGALVTWVAQRHPDTFPRWRGRS